MSTDLTAKAGIEESEQQTETEAHKATHALAERMLFGGETRPQPGPPRIILAIDCTSSMDEYIAARKITPEAATAMANALFAKAGSAGLRVQLTYFRGDDKSSKQPRQFRVSNQWYGTAAELAHAIAAIEHWSGWTQHCRLLRHAVGEAEKQAVQQLVIISDAFEEHTPLRPYGDDLVAAQVHAKRLRDLGVKISVSYKGTIAGGCPLNRAGVNAEEAFKAIAAANGGACFLCNPADLADRFGELASQATLAAQGNVAGAQVLLEHLQAVPFEMNVVGEQVPRCKP
jgi:hypothetical protein